jgi:hypothetical protein
MQPTEALSASAQIAVTLAGFAGVVVAFRNRSVHEWSRVDKFRLRILLVNSGVPFALSMLGMLFSASVLNQQRIWQTCSVLAFVITIMTGRLVAGGIRDLSREEFTSGGGSRAIFYSSSFVGIAVTLLQMYNAIALKTFWPFFAAITTLLLLAMLQFIRLVLAEQDSPK